LNYVSKHKEESAKHFGLTRKEAKMKREILFYFGKREKYIYIYFFIFAIFKNLRPEQKNQIFGSSFSTCFFARSYFCFKK
jgi:hypothetical protein